MILLADDNTLYALPINQTGGAQQIDARPFNALPYAVNYRLKGNDVIIFCSAHDDMRVYDGVNEPQVIPDAPKVSSMCVHYDRLFATTEQDKNTLVFSDDLDPTNWNIGIEEAGYITMTDDRGALLKVVSFLNNLYVFREYGISRLVAYGQQASFSLSHLFLSTGKIFGDTVVVCGNTILFLTELGLFQFDGSNAKKILSNLDGYFEGVDNSKAQADFCDGKYYLTANLNFDDGMTTFAEKHGSTNNAIVEVDLIKGSVNFLRGFDASCVIALKGDGINGLFVCFGDKSDYAYGIGQLQKGGRIFDSSTLKVWICPNFDLNSLGQKKKLCYITLLTKEDVTLVITVDEKEHYFDLVGKPNGQTIPINLTGENFGLKIVATTPTMYVSRPQLVFKEY